MARSLYDSINEFYTTACQHRRGQALLETARKGLDQFVFNIDVKDHGPIHFIYKSGQLIVGNGRGEAAPDVLNIEAEISEADMRDIIEGRLGVTDAQVQLKIYIPQTAAWDFSQRCYFSLWGSITRVGQDIVVENKVKTVDMWR